jgi:hypothetical protein
MNNKLINYAKYPCKMAYIFFPTIVFKPSYLVQNGVGHNFFTIPCYETKTTIAKVILP